MKKTLEEFGIAISGLITSLLTAVLVVAISRMTGFDLFTFSVWLVVPVGALLTGAVAASGYYFGSLYFHSKPKASLLAQMVVIAGVTSFLIYYLGYYTFVLDDGQLVREYMSFKEYLDVVLTKAHYRVGRAATDTGEVGALGYWLAGIQFVGFLAGGLAVYSALREKPICENCQKYLRPLARRRKVFASSADALDYWENLFGYPVDGNEFREMIRLEKNDSAVKGAVSIETNLQGCPTCKRQEVFEKGTVSNGRDWKDVPQMVRRVQVPEGINLIDTFRAK